MWRGPVVALPSRCLRKLPTSAHGGRRRTAERVARELRSFGRQPPPSSARGAGLFLPLAPHVRDFAGFAGEAFACLERPPPWRGRGLLPSRSARRRGAVPGLEMAPCQHDRGEIPDRPSADEPDIGVGRLDLGTSPPPLPVCVWLSRHPGLSAA